MRSFLLTERIEIFDFEENDTVDETWCEVKRKLHQQEDEDEDDTGAAAGENEGRGGELAANSTADATNSATIDATNAAATYTEVSATTATAATAATADAATAAATDTATDAAAVTTPQHLTRPVAIAVAKNSKPEIRNLFAVIADDKIFR